MAAFLQASDGDLDLTNGRLSLVTGQEEKRQKIENRLGLALGEWFADTREGTPWLESIVGHKNPDLEVVKRVLRSVITSVDGIEDAVIELQPLDDTRTLSGSFVATDDEGIDIPGSFGRPFIVNAPQQGL